MKKTQPQSKQVWKKTSCGIKTLLVFYIHLFSVWRLSADHWKPGAVSSVRSFKAGCLFKWDRSLCMWVMVVFWSTAASDLRDAQTSSHLIIHTTTGRRRGFPRQRRKLSGGVERIFCQHRLAPHSGLRRCFVSVIWGRKRPVWGWVTNATNRIFNVSDRHRSSDNELLPLVTQPQTCMTFFLQ